MQGVNMSGDKEFSATVSGVCLAIFVIILSLAIAFDAGHSVGLAKGKAEAIRPSIRQGELPYNTPVIVYTIREDGTIDGESAVRTDYAGVLPFSTTGHSVPFDKLEGWNYWTELDAIFSKEQP
jgi:hypothetical protein